MVLVPFRKLTKGQWMAESVNDELNELVKFTASDTVCTGVSQAIASHDLQLRTQDVVQ